MAMVRVFFADLAGKIVRGYATNLHETVIAFEDDTFIVIHPEGFQSEVAAVDTMGFDVLNFDPDEMALLGWP